jgi:hypothetical protein
MTFLEAAIELLRQAGAPLSVADLTARAVEQGLLTNAGRQPVSTMEARLAQELRKGPHTLLTRGDDGHYGLRRYDKPRRGESGAAPATAETAGGEVAAILEDRASAVPSLEPGPGAPNKPARRGKFRTLPPPPEPISAPGGEAFAEGARAAAVAPPSPAESSVSTDASEDDGYGIDAADGAFGEDAGRGGGAADASATTPGAAASGKKRRRRGGRGRGGAKAGAAGGLGSESAVGSAANAAPPPAGRAGDDARAELEAQPEPGTPEEALAALALAEEAEQEAAQEAVADAARRVEDARAAAALLAPPGDDEPAVDLDGFMAPVRSRRGLIDLPDEAALAEAYGDELDQGSVTPPVEGELVDEHTADEDRPMLEEITAADTRHRDRRGDRGRDRTRGRGPRRDERRPGGDRAAGNGGATTASPPPAGQQARRPAQTPDAPSGSSSAAAPVPAGGGPAGSPAAAPAGPARVLGLAEAGVQLLRSIGDGRPVHVRQLAAMAQKRKLVAGEPEDTWRGLRAALLDDARARLGRGLRPRVRHHGGGSFALTTTRLEPELPAIEEALASKAEALARETRAALRRRLVKLSPPALEQLVRVFLERFGLGEIERAKRVDQTSYLTARRRVGGVTTRLLVGIRSGGDDAGRRAVGELRAGIQAKQLDSGLLILCGRLGPEGEQELRKPGPPVEVDDGDAIAEAMIDAGVGVVRTALPVAYLDPDFFAELSEG